MELDNYELNLYKNKNTKGYNLTRSRKYHMKLFTSPIYSETCRTDDPFRSRVPNSSRAPSMHVDEFIALESKTENPAFALRRNPQVIDNCNLQHVFNAYF